MGIPIGQEATLIVAWSDRHRRDSRTALHHVPTGQAFLSHVENGGDQSNHHLDDQFAGCRAASAVRAAPTGHPDVGCLLCFVTGIGASRCRTVSGVIAGCDREQRRSDYSRAGCEDYGICADAARS